MVKELMARDILARVILSLMIALTIGGFIVLFASSAGAKTTRVCNTFTKECWWERNGHVVKRPVRRTYHKRKRHQAHKHTPQVRAYVKREDDEDRVKCYGIVRVVGSQWATESGAEESARKAWMEQVRWRFGESAMSIEAAQDYSKRCSRSSIGEVANSVLHRCEVQARPCRPVFESKGSPAN